MITWFKSISSGYILIAVGILIAIVLAYIYSLNYKINSLRADLAESKSQVVILSASIESQNQAIEKQGKDTANQLAIGAQAVKKQKAISMSRLGKINALQAQIGNKELNCEKAVEIAKGNL